MRFAKNLIITSCLLLAVKGATAQKNTPAITGALNIPLSWKIKAQTEIFDSAFLYPGFNAQNWVTADVPGTVFDAFVKAGLESDPNFGDNIYQVDKTKYKKNFVYRTEFIAPADLSADKTWLNFEGINSKGDIYLNGTKLGTLDGFMMRGKFDVSTLLQKGAANVLAVLVYIPEEPIVNWASPTYMASGGWDWMPFVPGLDMGITDDVYFSESGKTTLAEPWVRTLQVLSPTSAAMNFNVDIKNQSATTQTGTITGIITPGNIKFSQPLTLNPNEAKTLSLNKTLNNIKLWWPNGYGDPNLYNLSIKFTVAGKTSDSINTTFGIRKYTYDSLGNVLHISVNGKRIFLKGGNWGMSDYMLRCRGAEYETKLRFHKEMGMNMIRNWLGSTTDDEFYQQCDKYGVMVWDDFWLNNFFTAIRDMPRFYNNVVEKVKRVRNHASLAIWCGDNESTAFIECDTFMRNTVARYDLNDRRYQACSNQGFLSGSGLWTNFDPKQYFSGGTNFTSSTWGLRSEIGAGVFTTFESFKEFMPQANWWPRNDMWDKHFFGPSGAAAGPDNYMNSVNNRYGTATGIQDFCRKAQLLNIETHKAMFEGWMDNIWNDASGILYWMSQSAYPSLIWQTYDYYYDCTGAYWGVKKAGEPVHIQWNCSDDSVKVINTSGNSMNNLTATSHVYNMDGTELPGLGKTINLNAAADTSAYCFDVFNNYSKTYNLAYNKTATASSSKGANTGNKAFDASLATRWESNYNDNQWIYVDLGTSKLIGEVLLNWEGAYGKSYKIQVSADAVTWTDVYSTTTGDGGIDDITFTSTNARYVRMQGIKRGSAFGYSLYEFEVYAPGRPTLSNVNFLKLELKDAAGKLISDNFYWRSATSVFTDLNSLPVVNLNTTTQNTTNGSTYVMDAKVKNPAGSAGIAFAIHVQVINSATGKRILPVYMNDNYFTLFKGETKDLHIEFDTALLKGGTPQLLVEQYQQGTALNSTGVIDNSTGNTAVSPDALPYPNPFTNKVSIPVNMKSTGTATVEIFNTNGTRVKTFTANLPAGIQSVEWNATNKEGSIVAPGTYIANISADGRLLRSCKLLKL